MNRRVFVFGVCIIAVLLIALPATQCLAAGAEATKPFSDFINNLITMAQGIAGTLAVLMLIFGAIKLKTAQGNPQAQQQAKVTIAGAVAGLLLVVFAKDIIGMILKARGS
jgi:heme/copper-type cytochrome/quinol oxidase subunit 2